MFTDIFSGNSSKVLHAKEVCNTIRKYGSITKKDLQTVVGLPLTTLNRALESLMHIGLIEEAGISDSTLGRKPVLYSIKSNKYYMFGVEISRTSVKIILTDLAIRIIRKSSFEVDAKIEPYALIKKIAAEIKSILRSMKIDNDMVLGVGVGSVGPLNKKTGIVLGVEGFTDQRWKNFPIKQTLEKELEILTVINDGANAAVMGEYWGDMGKKYHNMVYMLVGVGLRCGIISNGLLINENKGIRNDVYGHIVVSVNGKPCYCGNQGCVERYVSIPAIVQDYRERLDHDSELRLEPDNVTWRRICESVKSGEKTGLGVITEAAFYLSAGLVNMINTLNPEVAIIGGAAINSCSILYDFAVSLAKEKLKNINDTVKFSRGSYGMDEIAVGSATLILDYYLGRELSDTGLLDPAVVGLE